MTEMSEPNSFRIMIYPIYFNFNVLLPTKLRVNL